jgi:RNA polymerase sigma-70 factor (ECF subfamily)
LAATLSVATAISAPVALEATPTTPAIPLDEDTWTAIFDENYDRIYRYAYARLGSRDEAEEMASQVFLEALRSRHLYREMDRPVLAWLYGIARNLVANHIRRRQRARNAHESLAQRLSLKAADLIVDRLDLARALSKLTPEQREVIVMRFLSGLSTNEIAALMGRNPGAVYSLQVRALAALRKVLTR